MAKHPTIFAKVLSEFIGTFFLTLTISLTVQNVVYSNLSIHPGIVIGLVLSALIYSIGHIGQAHFNVVVTLVIAFWYKPHNNLNDKPLMDRPLAILYMIAQVTASILAGGLGIFLSPWHQGGGANTIKNNNSASAGDVIPSSLLPFAKPISDTVENIGKAFVAELFWTCFLVYVILNVGFSPRQKGNNFYGFAIGMTVFGGIVCTGAVSGAAFNPAVATGLAVSYCMSSPPDGCVTTALKYLWIYWVACPLGGFLGVVLNALTSATEEQAEQVEVAADTKNEQGEKRDSDANNYCGSGCGGANKDGTSPFVIQCNSMLVDDDENEEATLIRRRGGDETSNPNEDGEEMKSTSTSNSNNSKSKRNQYQVCDLPGIGKVKKVSNNSIASIIPKDE